VNNDQRGNHLAVGYQLTNMATIFLCGVEFQFRLVHDDADGSHCVEIKLYFVLETHYRHANGQGEASAPAIQTHPLRDATQVWQQADQGGAFQDEASLVPSSAYSPDQVKILAPGVAVAASHSPAIHQPVQVRVVLDYSPRPATYGEVNSGSGESSAQGRYHRHSHEHIAQATGLDDQD